MPEHDIKQLIKDYLKAHNLMQVATVAGDQPWICSVYYAYDDDFTIYWISKDMRRHSKEIEGNSKVAAAIVGSHTPGDKVRGLQIEGVARMIPKISKEFLSEFSHYIKRFKVTPDRVKDIVGQIDKHQLYVIKPSKIVLFDEHNFPESPQQELVL